MMPGETPFDARLREAAWTGLNLEKFIAAQPAEHAEGYAAALAKRLRPYVPHALLPDWSEGREAAKQKEPQP